MNTFARKIGVCVVAAAALVTVSSEASAEYLVSVWENNTNVTIGGSYRWEGGSWKSFSVEPGHRFSTWLNLQDGQRPLFVRFDADPGPGVDRVGYRLRTYISPTTIFNYGATEAFQTRFDGRIDLVRTRP